ncbi:MAG: hypothetical protein KGL95_09095, partial [Patescibacteria group bacterium]|nr:hypothetical protein [Patescibacteria group bacterium]
VPLLNAYPVSPVLDAFISNHYHRRRRAYIAKAEQKLAEGGRDAIQLREFLAQKVMHARRVAKIYRGAENPQQLQETLAQQKIDLFDEKPVKHPQSNSEQPSLKQKLQKKPVIKIPLDTYDLIKDVRRHLEILRWKGKVESVEELEALVRLSFPTQSIIQKQ